MEDVISLIAGGVVGAIFVVTPWGDRMTTWIARQIKRWEGLK